MGRSSLTRRLRTYCRQVSRNATACGVNLACMASRVMETEMASTIPASDGCFMPTWPTVMRAKKLNASKLRARRINFAALAQDSRVFFENRKEFFSVHADNLPDCLDRK